MLTKRREEQFISARRRSSPSSRRRLRERTTDSVLPNNCDDKDHNISIHADADGNGFDSDEGSFSPSKKIRWRYPPLYLPLFFGPSSSCRSKSASAAQLHLNLFCQRWRQKIKAVLFQTSATKNGTSGRSHRGWRSCHPLIALSLIFVTILLLTTTEFLLMSNETLFSRKIEFRVTFPLPIRSDRKTTRTPLSSSILARSNIRKPEGFYRLGHRDYGILDIDSLQGAVFESGEREFKREIRQQDEDYFNYERSSLFDNMDHYLSNRFSHDAEQNRPRECERPNWRSRYYANCNTFHEIPLDGALDEYDEKFLGKGYYRFAYLMTPRARPSDPKFVMKVLRLATDERDTAHIPNAESFRKVQHEAIIMERLTSAPLIVTSYGHCGTSIFAENMPGEVSPEMIGGEGYITQAELNQDPDVRPRNNLTVEQKLDMALTQAEAIAYISGFEGGVIIHGDIHPVQYLRAVDGTIKLNDFNNAEIMEWGVDANVYCKSDRGAWGGMYRAPEEFLGEPIDEQIDVYSMGNNIYCLLTGLWPFYEDQHYSAVQAKVLQQERPFIDPRYRTRSFIERRLIEVMEAMWAHDPAQRPTIFAVVQHLRQTKASWEELKQTVGTPPKRRRRQRK